MGDGDGLMNNLRLFFYSCRGATARKPASIKDRVLKMFEM